MTRQPVELPPRLSIDNDLAQKIAITGPRTRWLKPLAAEEPPNALLESMQTAPVIYDPAFASHENSGSAEHATPRGRAIGQVIRLLPFSLVWALLVWGLVWILGLSAPYFLAGFALLTAVTYYRMDKHEFQYSRNGLEKHKVDAALTVRLTELHNSHELRKIALEGYLRHLEGRDNA